MWFHLGTRQMALCCAISCTNWPWKLDWGNYKVRKWQTHTQLGLGELCSFYLRASTSNPETQSVYIYSRRRRG